MNLASGSTTAKLRALNARRLEAGEYLDALVELADVDVERERLDQVEYVAGLRRRISGLRKRLRELEAHT